MEGSREGKERGKERRRSKEVRARDNDVIVAEGDRCGIARGAHALLISYFRARLRASQQPSASIRSKTFFFFSAAGRLQRRS